MGAFCSRINASSSTTVHPADADGRTTPAGKPRQERGKGSPESGTVTGATRELQQRAVSCVGRDARRRDDGGDVNRDNGSAHTINSPISYNNPVQRQPRKLQQQDELQLAQHLQPTTSNGRPANTTANNSSGVAAGRLVWDAVGSQDRCFGGQLTLQAASSCTTTNQNHNTQTTWVIHSRRSGSSPLRVSASVGDMGSHQLPRGAHVIDPLMPVQSTRSLRRRLHISKHLSLPASFPADHDEEDELVQRVEHTPYWDSPEEASYTTQGYAEKMEHRRPTPIATRWILIPAETGRGAPFCPSRRKKVPFRQR